MRSLPLLLVLHGCIGNIDDASFDSTSADQPMPAEQPPITGPTPTDPGTQPAEPAAPDCDPTTPPPATAGVDFATAILPILTARCTGCHDRGGDAGLSLLSHGAVLAGGDGGPVVDPGSCTTSVLHLKTGPTPPFGARMPLGDPALPDAERDLICRWIDEGALAVGPPSVIAEPCPDGSVAGASCGDMRCETAAGESCSSCPDDCGACAVGDDRTAPTFDGIDYVVEAGTACTIYWDPAIDDASGEGAITYRIYASREGQPIELSAPVATSHPGALSHTIPLPRGEWDVLVRAVDEADNEDANTNLDTCEMR